MRMLTKIYRLVILCGILMVIFILSSVTRAADHTNLEEGLPVETTDAYPIPYLGREIQTVFNYDRGHEGVDSFIVTPRLEFGFPRNGQISIEVPVLFGEIEPDDIGETRLEWLYNFNQETLLLPAFAVTGAIDLPTGEDSQGVDPLVKFIITKTLSRSSLFHRLHVNLAYQFNDDEQPRERSDWYKASIGYSARLSNETLFVADYVREERKEEDIEFNLIETGVRYQLTPLTVISGGLGFGIGDESPDVRAILGFQYTF